MDVDEARGVVDGLMPGVVEDLVRLVGHASVAFPGFPPNPVYEAAFDVLSLFTKAGVADARLLDLGPGSYPAIFGEVAGPPGSPTVLCYAHYDVQPAPADSGWHTDPWQATVGADGRIYGRGAADDKSGVVAHLGMLRAFDGRPPVTVKILIEGEEETGGHLEDYVAANPALFTADAFIVFDSGNVRAGEPVLTTSLRGSASCTVTVSTLENPVHSGEFGGAAPDALLALIRILAGLHTPEGDVAVAGLESADWSGAELSEADFRSAAGVLDGVALTGTGSIGSRIWSRPSVTVLGLDAPRVAGAPNALVPTASAGLGLRVPPGTDPEHALSLLIAHVRAGAPGGVQLDVRPDPVGQPFAVDEKHPVLVVAREAMAAAFGAPVSAVGSGGSIPLVSELTTASPGAAVILWGAEDYAARIHGPDESVDVAELARMITAQVLFLAGLAQRES